MFFICHNHFPTMTVTELSKDTDITNRRILRRKRSGWIAKGCDAVRLMAYRNSANSPQQLCGIAGSARWLLTNRKTNAFITSLRTFDSRIRSVIRSKSGSGTLRRKCHLQEYEYMPCRHAMSPPHSVNKVGNCPGHNPITGGEGGNF